MHKAAFVRLLTLIVLTALLSLGLSANSFAATTGTVRGTVTSGGAPVQGATVTIVGTGLTTKTDKTGSYVFVGVQPGQFSVSVSGASYKTAASDVTVTQDQESLVNFSLTIATSSRITLQTVRTAQTQAAYTIGAGTEQKTKSQPNNLYQFPGLTFGQPGITPDPSGYTHIRGSDFNQVGFDVDGVQVTEPMTNSFATNLVTVGLQSANLYTGSADASFGNASGGFINEITNNGRSFATNGKNFGGVVEGTFGPDHGWNYTGTNTQLGGITENRKLDFYASTVAFDNDFPGNTQISKLNSSFDGVVKLNYYADPKNTITAFISGGNENYLDYDPFNSASPLSSQDIKFTGTTATHTGTFQNDHDNQGYGFDYLTFKHGLDQKSFLQYQFYRLADFVTFHAENLAGEYENRHSDTLGNKLDYTNAFSKAYTLKTGLEYDPSTTSYHVITGITAGVGQSGDPNWMADDYSGHGYTDRYSPVKPKQTAFYISNAIKPLGDKATIDLGYRFGQMNFDRVSGPGVNVTTATGVTRIGAVSTPDYTDKYADPRLGLTYSPVKDLLFRTSYAQSSEFPDSDLVERLFPENGLTPVTATDPQSQLTRLSSRYPNTVNLQTLHSGNYDFGLEKAFNVGGVLGGQYSLTASTYRRDQYDALQLDYNDYTGAASPYPFHYGNAATAHSSGVELQFSKRQRKATDWNGFFSYTNQIAKANASDFDTGYLPYFASFDYADPGLTAADYTRLNKQEFRTSYDQRHTVAVVASKRFFKYVASSFVLDAGSGFPFAGGAPSDGTFGATDSQHGEKVFGGADFTEVPVVLLNNTTIQPINPNVGNSGWHYKISINTDFNLSPSTNLFLNVDNVFDKQTALTYATTTQAGAIYYTPPSAQYPEGRINYGKSTIITPIFVTFGFRSKF